MIRQIYLDFVKDKLMKGDARWLFDRSLQYLLTRLSFIFDKPLCGPVLGTLATNYSCNYNCRMCGLPARGRSLEQRGLKKLSTADLKRVIKNFAEMKTGGIGFTGGEPMMSENIYGLLRYTKQLGMFSHLNTNGYFVDKTAAGQLADCGVDSVNISLDGACARTHDEIRNFRGAFDRAVRALENIQEARNKNNARLRLKFVTVVSAGNILEIPELIKLAARYQADCIEFIPEQGFSENPDRAGTADSEFLKRVRTAARALLALKKKGVRIENSPDHLKLWENSFTKKRNPFACYAGYNSCVVDCYGEVYPCVPWLNWGKSLGNLNGSSLKEFWYDRYPGKTRKEIKKCRACYLNCQTELNILYNP